MLMYGVGLKYLTCVEFRLGLSDSVFIGGAFGGSNWILRALISSMDSSSDGLIIALTSGR